MLQMPWPAGSGQAETLCPERNGVSPGGSSPRLVALGSGSNTREGAGNALGHSEAFRGRCSPHLLSSDHEAHRRCAVTPMRIASPVQYPRGSNHARTLLRTSELSTSGPGLERPYESNNVRCSFSHRPRDGPASQLLPPPTASCQDGPVSVASPGRLSSLPHLSETPPIHRVPTVMGGQA